MKRHKILVGVLFEITMSVACNSQRCILLVVYNKMIGGIFDSGEIIDIIDGEDGEPCTEYEVDYADDGCFMVDHLLEDYIKGDLKFL